MVMAPMPTPGSAKSRTNSPLTCLTVSRVLEVAGWCQM